MKNTISKMFNKFFEDNCIYYAAASVFFLITCFLPFMLILLNIARFFPVQAEDIVRIIAENAPPQIAGLFEGLVKDVLEKRSFLITSFSIVFTVYTAGQGFMAIMKALDTIYEVKTQRTWVLKRLKSTAYTFLFMFVIIMLVVMYVYGGYIIDRIEPINPDFASVMSHIVIRRFLIMPVVLLIIFQLMYMYVPNRKGGFWENLFGAIIATIGAIVFTMIFSLIVSHSPQFNYMYGSIANIIFTLFWLFAIFLIIFIGAEFNTYIEKGWIVLPKWMRASEWKIVKKLSYEDAEGKKDKNNNKQEKKKEKKDK